MSLANNILTISPKGKEYYCTPHWIKQFLNMLNIKWVEVESEVFGPFDGNYKGKHQVVRYQSNPLTPTEFAVIETRLDNFEEVDFKGWRFQKI